MRRQIGSIEKLGKDYYKVTVTAGVNPQTGKQTRKTKRIRGSRTDAEKALIALTVSVGKGDSVKESMTLDTYWNDVFLPNAKGRIRDRTISGYKDNYNLRIRDHLGGLLLSQINPPVIDRWLAGFEKQRTRYDAFRMLRIILRRAVKDRLLESSPTDHFDEPKHKKYKPEVLDAKEATVYLKCARGTVIEPMVLVMLGAGLRIEEFVPLDWGDITPEGDIRIDKASTYYRGQTFDDGTKTDFSERTVHLPQTFTDRLNELRMDDGVPLMHKPTGERMTYNMMYHAYKRWQETLPDDVRRIPPKNLRHTSLTLTLEGGAELLTVSRRAGHSSTHITAQYYLRPHKSVDEAAAAGLGGLVEL